MSTLVSYDPFRQFRSLQGEINRLFEQGAETSTGQLAPWPMRVDIREDDHQVTIKADIPGMEQKDIQVNVDNGTLTIAGERAFVDEENKDLYHRVERSYGRFSRSFQLPNTTDVNGITASYKQGVLEINLPKREEAKPRAIQVAIN